MICKYNKDEFCINDQCPMCADYCPVPDTEGVCKYEEREDVFYKITPKVCLRTALLNSGLVLEDNTMNNIWSDFVEIMTELGYIQEEE